MFRESSYEQLSFNDRMFSAGDQAKNAVDKSRAKLVGDIIYPNVDEKLFAGLYSSVGSRPNIEIKRYVAAFVLKRMYGLSDETFIEFLRCGALNFQYALHTTDEEIQPLSESSLVRFRKAVTAYNAEHKCDLIKEEFERISKIMATDMGLLPKDPSDDVDEDHVIMVRMDSMEIEAHAKSMARVEILYMTNVILIRFLLKKGFKNVIPSQLLHYLEDGDHNKVTYYRVANDKKEGIQDTRVSEIVSEMLLLKESMEHCFSTEILSNIPEYQVFLRVIDEQTYTDFNGMCIPKDKKDISPNSVQNPFDTTATYRFKGGHHRGHVLNVAEAIDGQGNGIIISGTVDANTRSDNSMAIDYVNDAPDDNSSKQILTADGAYNSDELEEIAAKKNIKVQTTSLVGKAPEDIIADFVLDGSNEKISSCPAGYVPTSNKYNGNNGYITAVMPNNCCASCPHRDKCKAKVNNKKHKSTVRVTAKMVTRAKQARNFSTDEGKANARRRNGVEGIMSVMRRKYKLDHIQVFSIEKLKSWVWASLLSYNLVKYQKYRASLGKQLSAA